MSTTTAATSTATGPAETVPDSSQRGGDRLSDVAGRGLAADVARARTLGQHALDRAHDGLARVLVSEVLEHHRARPDLPDRVGDVPARDVRRRAVHRLEHRREFAFRVDVARGGDADGAGAGGAEVREGVAEEVRPDHDVEPVRMLHEVGGEDVDVVLVGLDLWVARGHGANAFVPVGHGDRDPLRLGGRGAGFLWAGLRELERVLEYAVDARPGE